MSWHVVIGTAPTMDTSVVAGPFRSLEAVAQAESELTARGWNAETVTCSTVDEIPIVTEWGAS